MISAQATIPTSDHTLTRADGRRVAWAEWGDPEGQPVVLLHRNPGSRLLDPDPRATAAAGARLITIDRPGYGRTDSVAEPTLFAVSSDLADVVDGIGLDEVALIGCRAGACSRSRQPQRSDRAHAHSRCCARRRPTKSSRGCRTSFENLRRRCSQIRRGHSPRSPMHASSMPRLNEVKGPVRLWYGEADWIGPEHGRWYAEGVADAHLAVVAGAGHLLPLANWRAILDAALIA